MNFTETAASRETSQEIVDAIWIVAGRSEAEAVRVWESPTEPEMIAIWERVTGNGQRDASDYCWGASGDRWAVRILQDAMTADFVLVQMMPDDLRASHRAAGNWGRYPNNGAKRVIVKREHTREWRYVDGEAHAIETDEYDIVLRAATPEDFELYPIQSMGER